MGSVLSAKPKRGMSYTWRSILSGFELLKKGVVWRVGDGSSIKIWEDPWLPKEHTRRPFMPRRNCLLTRVDELIDPTVGTWDEALIRDLFWEDDAKMILCIPVHDGMEDIIS